MLARGVTRVTGVRSGSCGFTSPLFRSWSSSLSRVRVVVGNGNQTLSVHPNLRISLTSPILCNISKMSYATEARGSPNTPDYRRFFRNEDGAAVSPMHDIPLVATSAASSDVYNVVIEVPRWSNAKMEINLKEDLNPIKQDVKKGNLRYVANCFPHKGYIWNYGFIPQTWENPDHIDESTKCKGDGDPIDVCEIGHKVREQGDVVRCKILGTVALIDEGETDWKVLAIDVDDPLAESLNDVNDIETHMPGFLAATVEWFKIYKMPDGKPANQFAFDGQAKDKAFAVKIVNECHDQWKEMMAKESCDSVNRKNTTLEGPHKISKEEADNVVNAAAPVGQSGSLPELVNKWHYPKL